MFKIKSKKGLNWENGVLKVSFCDKIKIILGIFPNKNLKKLIKIGKEKLEI